MGGGGISLAVSNDFQRGAHSKPMKKIFPSVQVTLPGERALAFPAKTGTPVSFEIDHPEKSTRMTVTVRALK